MHASKEIELQIERALLICPNMVLMCRERTLNTNFFSLTFRAPPGYPGKIPGYPAQNV